MDEKVKRSFCDQKGTSLKKSHWKLSCLQGWVPAVTHVAYLQLDCARGLLEGLRWENDPVNFGAARGLKKECSAVGCKCAILACASILGRAQVILPSTGSAS